MKKNSNNLLTTSPSPVGLLHPFPMDCVQIMKNGNKRNGVYTVYINNDRSKPIEAYCDMDTDGGGWLVGIFDMISIKKLTVWNFCLTMRVTT